jgi:hypothetical protein
MKESVLVFPEQINVRPMLGMLIHKVAGHVSSETIADLYRLAFLVVHNVVVIDGDLQVISQHMKNSVRRIHGLAGFHYAKCVLGKLIVKRTVVFEPLEKLVEIRQLGVA